MANRRRALLVPALMEGAGILLLALVGSDLMFGTELGAAGSGASTIPALAVAVATVAYRLRGGDVGADSGRCDDRRADLAPVTSLERHRRRSPRRSRRAA